MITLIPNLTDKFTIIGKGMILAVNRKDYPDHEFKVGEIILYCDEKYEIVGIELFYKLSHPPILGDNVGLIVKKVSE